MIHSWFRFHLLIVIFLYQRKIVILIFIILFHQIMLIIWCVNNYYSISIGQDLVWFINMVRNIHWWVEIDGFQSNKTVRNEYFNSNRKDFSSSNGIIDNKGGKSSFDNEEGTDFYFSDRKERNRNTINLAVVLTRNALLIIGSSEGKSFFEF